MKNGIEIARPRVNGSLGWVPGVGPWISLLDCFGVSAPLPKLNKDFVQPWHCLLIVFGMQIHLGQGVLLCTHIFGGLDTV